jgi:hypothetical protein
VLLLAGELGHQDDDVGLPGGAVYYMKGSRLAGGLRAPSVTPVEVGANQLREEKAPVKVTAALL